MTRRSRPPDGTASSRSGDEGARRGPQRLAEPAEDRAELEVLRDVLIKRLHRRSNDFDATRELRLVYSRLQRTSYGKQTVTRFS